MNKIALIVPYFGELPNYFDLFLKSCSYNPQIDWLFFTDNKISNKPPNVKVFPMTFEEVQKKIEAQLNQSIFLPAPYKLCDFRPAYGKIFESYLTDYSFWGHCDNDLIFGDLSKTITNTVLEKYDKIFSFGHLTLYRNNEKVNHYFQLDSDNKENNFYHCIAVPEAMYFDEIGMNRLLEEHNIDYYSKPEFLDIWPQSPYFKHRCFGDDKNYSNQYFVWEDGHVFKYWSEKSRLKRKEYSYIHFQKRQFSPPSKEVLQAKHFIISSSGFYPPELWQDPQISKPNFEQVYRYYKKRYQQVSAIRIKRTLKKALFFYK